MSEDNREHEITVDFTRPYIAPVRTRQKAVSIEMPSLDEIFAEGEMYERNAYINSILEDLPDHRIAEINQKQDYAEQNQLIKKMHTVAKDAAMQASRKFISEHPEAEALGYKHQGRVFSERYARVNYTQALAHMLDCMMERPATLTTQKAILESVKKSTGIQELNHNIWQMPLKKFMKRHLYERLKSYGMELSLATCKNMSELRKAILADYAKMKSIHKLRVDLTFTPNEIIVNDTTHKITTVTSGAYKYRKIRLHVNNKRTWINVNELETLFGLA